VALDEIDEAFTRGFSADLDVPRRFSQANQGIERIAFAALKHAH
jgi:hypothetical protein